MADVTLSTQVEIMSQTVRVPHGDFSSLQAALDKLDAFGANGLFTAHLASWMADNGEVRDPKIVLAANLIARSEFRDVGIALTQRMSPAEVLKVLRYIKSYAWPLKVRDGNKTTITRKTMGLGKNVPHSLKSALTRYLERKDDELDGMIRAGQDDDLRGIYASLKVKPFDNARMLFDKHPSSGLLASVAELHGKSPEVQAELIIKHRIPYVKAVGAVSVINAPVLYALIDVMTQAQLIHNMESLQKREAFNTPEIKALIERKLAKTTGKASLRQSKAIDKVQDADVKAALEKNRTAQIKKRGTLTENVLIIVDISGSQATSVKLSKKVLPYLAEVCTGNLSVICFNDHAVRIKLPKEVNFDSVEKAFRGVGAEGGTRLTCAFESALDQDIKASKLVIFTDEDTWEDASAVAALLTNYVRVAGVEPTLVIVNVNDAGNVYRKVREGADRANIVNDSIELSRVDDYAIGQIINLITSGKRGIIQEVLDTDLLEPY